MPTKKGRPTVKEARQARAQQVAARPKPVTALSVVASKAAALAQAERAQRRELVQLCRDQTGVAVQLLAKLVRDEGVDPKARILAARELLDRGWGKSPLAVDVTHHYSAEELQIAARAILERRQQEAHLVEASIGPGDISESSD